jgi:hypothetical protein
VTLHAQPFATHVIGLAKCCVGVTTQRSEFHRQIGACLLEQQDLAPSRRVTIDDRRQLFDVGFDRVDAVLGERRALRQNQSQRLPDVTDLVPGDCRLAEWFGSR